MTEEARRRDRLVGLFVLGLALFSPPLVLLFGSGGTLFGMPMLFVYLFVAWAALIACIAAIAEGGRGREPPADET